MHGRRGDSLGEAGNLAVNLQSKLFGYLGNLRCRKVVVKRRRMIKET